MTLMERRFQMKLRKKEGHQKRDIDDAAWLVHIIREYIDNTQHHKQEKVCVEC